MESSQQYLVSVYYSMKEANFSTKHEYSGCRSCPLLIFTLWKNAEPKFIQTMIVRTKH